MPCPKPFPPYPKHPLKHGGGARIKINGKSFYLGKHGSESSYAEYRRLQAEHALGIVAPPLPAAVGLSVSDLIADWTANEPRGRDHPEVQRILRACVPLSRLFGPTPANEFRANRLRAVQDSMASQSWMTAEEREHCGPWSRRYINKNIERLLRVFSWGESTERLPMGITEHLRTVPDLRATDKRVKDNPPRQPVDWESQVKPCLPHLSPVVRAMLTVQYYAGMRPSEVCRMRRCEIDQVSVEGVWLYRPETHKTQHAGHDLIKVLGPNAQRAIAPWLMAAEPDGFIFPPAKRRNGAAFYLPNGVAQAVRRAIKASGVKPWAIYQIRHAAGHRVDSECGRAAAAAHLGHASLETTRNYTDRQRLDLAIETARKIG